MSMFQRFANQANTIAKTVFAAYIDAENNLAAAEATLKECRLNRNVDRAKLARAEANTLEAQSALKAAKATFESRTNDLMELRRQLAEAVEDAYSMNPAALDTATLELLRSNILTAGEFERLLRKAKEDGNATMVRLIGRYAKREAEAQAVKNGQNDVDVRRLRAVSYDSSMSTGSEHLRQFDALIEAYNRTARNPGMINSWDKIVGEIVRNF